MSRSDQYRVADPDLLATLQLVGTGYALVVDKRPVRGSEILEHHPTLAMRGQRSVLAREFLVRQLKIGILIPPDDKPILISFDNLSGLLPRPNR